MKLATVCLCIVAIQWPASALHAAPDSTSQQDPLSEELQQLEVSVERDVAESLSPLVCEKIVHALRPSTKPKARFTVRKNGRIAIDRDADKNTFAFEGTYPLVKIQTLPTSHKQPSIAACEHVNPDTIYELPDQEPDQEPHLITVFVYDQVDHDEQYLVDYRAKALADLRQRERDALHADPALQTFITLARMTFLRPRDDGMLAEARTAATNATTALQKVQNDFGCGGANGNNPDHNGLQPAICDEALALESAIASIKRVLDKEPVEERLKMITAETPRDLLAGLKPTYPLDHATRTAQCERVQRYRWLDLPRAPRLVTVASLPIVGVLSHVDYGQTISPAEPAEANTKRGLLVTAIPYGQKIKFAESQGERTTLAINVLFSAIVGQGRLQLFPSMTNVKQALQSMEGLPVNRLQQMDLFKGLLKERQNASETISQKDLKALRNPFEEKIAAGLRARTPMDSQLCKGDEGDEGDDAPLQFDADLPASSNLEHRAHIFSVDRDHKLTVALCAGIACTGKDDDKEVKARVSLTPSRKGTFTLLAEISGGIGIYNGSSHDGGFDTMSAPEFKPVHGIDGPDQIYEMQRTPNPADVISTSLLLAYHISDRHLVAAGPSLTTGTSGNVFKQWNLRLGRSFANGFMVTAGVSLRAIPFPQDFKIGDRVSVPRGMDTEPPDVRRYYTPEWQAEIGLAFDLSGIGGLASDAYKAIGGK